ncbi:MAG: hypothetical protein ACRERU_12985 [Methylococcales bacterium]
MGSDHNEADDATNEHYSMFVVEEEGTLSSFLDVQELIEAQGLFSALYTGPGQPLRRSPFWESLFWASQPKQAAKS